MKIAVFGAAGGAGGEIVKQALEQGHEVTAIVRRPEQMKQQHERLRVASGDALKPDSFAGAFNGQEAVLSALGISSFWASLKPMTFHRESARNIVEQMKKQTVRRFVGITSVSVIKNPTAPFWYNLFVQPLLNNKYEDMRQMEKIVGETDLDWTIVRPFRLIDGERTGKYRVAANGELENGGAISRADIAEFMLKQLETKEYLHKNPAVSY